MECISIDQICNEWSVSPWIRSVMKGGHLHASDMSGNKYISKDKICHEWSASSWIRSVIYVVHLRGSDLLSMECISVDQICHGVHLLGSNLPWMEYFSNYHIGDVGDVWNASHWNTLVMNGMHSHGSNLSYIRFVMNKCISMYRMCKGGVHLHA